MGTENPAENMGLPNDYRKTNKLDYVLDSSTRALNGAKYAFYDQLNKYVQVEKEFCRKMNKKPQMAGEQYQRVCNFLDMAPNFYWVEALAQFVFDECIIPTYDELTVKAQKIKNISSLWLPDRRRAYNL